MSYPGVDPSDIMTTEPVGTQAISEGNPLIVNHAGLPPGVSDEVDVEKVVQQKVSEMFAVTEAWKPKGIIKFVIEFESGQQALVKYLDTMDMINIDLIEDMDFFSKKLFATQQENAENDFQKTFWGTLRDVNNRKRFLDMTGKLMEASSIKPKIIHDGVAIVEDEETGKQQVVFGNEVTDIGKQIELFGGPVSQLKDGQTYSSAIDIGDRLTFFQELNKPLALIEPFREKQDSVLERVQPIQELELPSF